MSAETHTLVKPIFNLAALAVILIGGWLVYAHFLNIGLPTMLPSSIVPAPTIASVKPAAVVVPTVPFVSAPPMPSAAQQAEQKRIALERTVAAQQAANALAQRKVAAWSQFYQAPASCEHPASWEAQVECGNQYIRAKKAFEMQWEAQLRAEQPARDAKAAEVGGG